MGVTRRQTIELSPRQRQVVEMIAAGRTNPEIAAALGISLQGAKWHVSEVLARLSVSTREEAADAWRRRQALRERTGRLLSGLAGLGPLKAGLAGSGVAAAAVCAVIAVAVLRANSDLPQRRDINAASASQISKMSQSEAETHARYAAGEYLKQTDIPQKVSINGRPMTAADLVLAEIKFVPAGTDPSMYYSTYSLADIDTWVATFRRENVPMPHLGWSDGVVDVTIRFADEDGNVKSASAGQINPHQEVLPAPPYRPPDMSNQNRVTDFFEVLSLGAADGPTIHVYGTAGGDWCWVAGQPQGAAVISCGISGPDAEHLHIFNVAGTGRGWTLGKELLPARFGAVTADVASVALVFADGGAVEAETLPFPEATGQAWRAFAVMEPPGAAALMEVIAFDASGRELSRYVLPTIPAGQVAPYVVKPLVPITFAGSGAAAGGDFELPPPAFTGNIRLLVKYEGDVTATIVCDTGETPIVESGKRAAFAREEAPETFLLLMPPEARQCRFEVSGSGTWSFRSP